MIQAGVADPDPQNTAHGTSISNTRVASGDQLFGLACLVSNISGASIAGMRAKTELSRPAWHIVANQAGWQAASWNTYCVAAELSRAFFLPLNIPSGLVPVGGDTGCGRPVGRITGEAHHPYPCQSLISLSKAGRAGRAGRLTGRLHTGLLGQLDSASERTIAHHHP